MACVYVGRVHACVRARAQSSTCACVRGPLLKHIQELITEIIQWLAAAAPTVPPLLEVRGRRQPRREREKMVARREVDRKQSRADMKVEGWIGVEEEERKKNKTKQEGRSLSLSLRCPRSISSSVQGHGCYMGARQSPRPERTRLMRYGPADNYKQPLWIKAIKPEGTFDPALYHRRDLV